MWFVPSDSQACMPF